MTTSSHLKFYLALQAVLTIGAVTNGADLINWNLDEVNYPEFPDPAVNNTPFDGIDNSTASVATHLSVSDLTSDSSDGHNGLVWSSGAPGPNKLNLQRWDHPNDNPANFGNGNGNPNNWLEFSLNADPGYQFTITSLVIAAWRNGAGAPATWAVETSSDGGVNWLPFGTAHSQNTAGDGIFQEITFTDNFSANSSLIRFIAIGPEGGSGNLHINKLSLAGTVETDGSAPAETVILFQENFNGDAETPLAGRSPSTNLLSNGEIWDADEIIAANGQVNDGNNTDRGAAIPLGSNFTFLPDATYTLDLSWENLENAILFAGFNSGAPKVNAQMQTQANNFGLRARRIAPGDPLGAWLFTGSAVFTQGQTATPSTGTTSMVINTNSLSNATFSVDGATQTIDLTTPYNYLWLGYEDPTSGTSNARFSQLTLTGPAPLPTEDLPEVSFNPNSPIIEAGTMITLSSDLPGSIFYTLDGTTPNANSTPYNQPFPLTESATVRAVAINENDQAGPVVSQTYTVSQPIGTPNLLIIVGDQVGFGDLHVNGGVSIATPALDSIAYDGIRFTQFTATGPGATQNQYALLSGRVAPRSGMSDQPSLPDQGGWGAEEWTLAEALRKRGYQTSFIGEWLLGNAAGSHPNDQGFQNFYGLPYALAQAPPLEQNREVITPAPPSQTLLANLTQQAVKTIATSAEPFALIFQPPNLEAPGGSSLAGPHGKRIEALDNSVAQLLDTLESNNLTDSTLVLFLGNGGAPRTEDGGSNGIFTDGQGTTWEGGLRTPLLAKLPGTLPAAQMNLSLVWMPDLMPTLAALVGGELAADRPLDGVARPNELSGQKTRADETDTAFSFRFINNQWQIATVRQQQWKSHLLINNIDPENNRPTSGAQLYDLHIDAEERINRAGQQAAIVSQLGSLAGGLSFPPTGTSDLPAPKPAVEGQISSSIHAGTPANVLFSFIRPSDSINDNYSIEHSDNLLEWESLEIGPFIEMVTPLSNQRENLELNLPLGTAPLDGNRRFIRLRAERPASL